MHILCTFISIICRINCLKCNQCIETQLQFLCDIATLLIQQKKLPQYIFHWQFLRSVLCGTYLPASPSLRTWRSVVQWQRGWWSAEREYSTACVLGQRRGQGGGSPGMMAGKLGSTAAISLGDSPSFHQGSLPAAFLTRVRSQSRIKSRSHSQEMEVKVLGNHVIHTPTHSHLHSLPLCSGSNPGVRLPLLPVLCWA